MKIGVVYACEVHFQVMEFLDAVPYEKYCQMFPVADFAEQLLRGVKAMHENGLSHLDIKPDNIVVVKEDENKFVVKMFDVLGGYFFESPGKSKISCETKNLVMTREFSSPEFKLQENFDVIDYDMWSSVVTIVHFLHLKIGFTDYFKYYPQNQEDWNIVLDVGVEEFYNRKLFEKSKTCFLFRKKEFDLSKFSSELIDFLCEMTHPKPEERYHNKEIDIFSHPLFGKDLQNKKKVTRFSLVPWTPSSSFEPHPFKHESRFVSKLRMDINNLSNRD